MDNFNNKLRFIYLITITAIVGLIAIQVNHHFNIHSSTSQSKDYKTPEITAQIQAQLDPLDISTLSSLQVNKDYHIIIKGPVGNTLYWNSSNVHIDKTNSIVISHNNYIALLQKKSNNETKNITHTENHVLSWLTFFILILLNFISLYFLLVKWKALQKNNFIFGLTSILFTSVLFLISGHYIHVPKLVQEKFFIFHFIPFNLSYSITVFIAIAFLVSHIKRHTKPLKKRSNILSLLSSFIISSLFYTLASIISGVVKSDLITVNLSTPLQYNSKGVFFIWSLLLISVSIFYSSLIIHRVLSKIETDKPTYIPMVTGVILFSAICFLANIDLPIIPLTVFVISYSLILDLYIDQVQKTAVFVFLWLIIYAGFISANSFYTQLEKDIEVRERSLKTLYTVESKSHTDIVKSIDATVRNSMVSSQLATLPYPAKLDRADITSYVTKQFATFPSQFDIAVEAYDAEGATLFKNHFSQEQLQNESIAKSNRVTEFIYYNPFESNYILNYYIENKKYTNSSLRLIIRLSNKINQNLSLSPSFNYYVLNNNKLIDHNQSKLPISQESLSTIKDNKIIKDNSYVVFKPADNILVGSYQKIGGLLKPISLFSFILTLSGILLFFIGILNSRFQFLPSELDFSLHFDSSLKNKIQYTIIALIIFSFILIGLMTILYFKNVLELRNKKDKEIQITSIINDINTTITTTADNEGKLSVIQNQLSRLSHVHQRKLNLYDRFGQLIGASYNNPSEFRIPFNIYNRNTDLDHAHSTNNYDRLHYIPLLASVNNQYATIGVLDNSTELNNHSLLDFLSTILNVYIFLFLLAGAIAIAISNSITKPLTYLSSRLRQFKLGKGQDKLSWSSNDEIGSLIDSYNELTSKLDESANIIAKTERDTAWREMAKQVAHEIKNPLTPMKLSIQHLQRMSDADPQDLKSRLDRISKTLLEQFNNLDNIANSFSNFATMPTASNEKIILNEVVESIHDLFRKREDIHITLSEPITDLYIYADRNHVVRVLNNIVKNAIQAIPNDRSGEVHISLEQLNNNALVKVKDNGSGIPEHMKEKVFTPNFTTKNSGTGLGLAISANMIEAFNGRIYFETVEGEGTSFFIEIPLMRLDNNFENDNRVVLD